MASTSVSISSPSSCTTDFAANDTFLGFKPEVVNPNQAVKKAKEQLCQATEVKEEEDMWQWMEMRWEEQMSEWDSVVRLVDRNLAREAGKHAVVEIWKKWFLVSVSFSSSWYSDFDFVF